MSESRWRYAAASVIGAAHEKSRKPCQDSGDCVVLYAHDGSQVLVAVASDGAGSAERSDVGSQLACRSFIEAISALIGSGQAAADVTREFVVNWLAAFRAELEVIAAAEGRSPRDFACTFLAAVIDDRNAAFCQIGDGAIVMASADESEEFSWIFWPQHGEYANQTYFASQVDAASHLNHETLYGKQAIVEEVFIFTDGIERLVLDLANQIVHQPFFRTIVRPLRCQPSGYSLTFSEQMGAFLCEPRVADRSDDDRTLVVATRRMIAPEPLQ